MVYDFFFFEVDYAHAHSVRIACSRMVLLIAMACQAILAILSVSVLVARGSAVLCTTDLSDPCKCSYIHSRERRRVCHRYQQLLPISVSRTFSLILWENVEPLLTSGAIRFDSSSIACL